MINFEDVIVHFGKQVGNLLKQEGEEDIRTVRILKDRDAPERSEAISDWLRMYKTFRGLVDAKRHAIAEAVLGWADSRDKQSQLTSVDALAEAHESLEEVCARAYGEKRNFTSLASKALWLRYPENVPLFDSHAQRALWVISKLETDIAPLRDNEREYRKFAHIWKALSDRYKISLNRIDIGEYPYRVRIFDKILWLVGEESYGRAENKPSATSSQVT